VQFEFEIKGVLHFMDALIGLPLGILNGRGCGVLIKLEIFRLTKQKT
jgi:hypothetical protein